MPQWTTAGSPNGDYSATTGHIRLDPARRRAWWRLGPGVGARGLGLTLMVMNPVVRNWKATVTSLLVELALFLCSYAPLFAILAIRFQRTSLIVVCALFAAAGLAAGGAVLLRFRTVTPGSWVVRAVEDRGGEVAGYLATYLLPFVTVAEPDVRDVIAYGLFVAIVAVIFVRSSLVQINPTLYLFGWRLLAIEIGDGFNGYLLTRRRIKRGDEVGAVRMTERLFVNYAKRGSDAG